MAGERACRRAELPAAEAGAALWSRRWPRLLAVEPALLLYTLGMCIGNPAAQQLIYSKYCDRAAATAAAAAAAGAAALANSSAPIVCEDPGSAADAASVERLRLYEDAQRATSRMVLYCIVTLTLPQLAACAVLGVWSDRRGRKWPVLVPLVGSAAGYGCWALIAWQPASDPAYALVACFVLGATGYFGGTSLTAFGYLTAAVPAERRTFRVAIAEGALNAGLLIGLVTSGVAIERLGLTVTFVAVAGVNALAAIYCALRLDEIGPRAGGTGGGGESASAGRGESGGRRSSDISMDEASGHACCLRCVGLRRGGHAVTYLYGVLASYFVGCCATTGAGDLTYLYLTKARGFGADQYGFYAAADVALKLSVGGAALALLRRFFGIGDLAVAAAGCASAAAAYAALGAAPWTWLVWVSAPLDAMQFAYNVGVRSFVSKLVAKSAQGRAFALLADAQVGATIAAALLFNNLYPATIGFFPGLSFVVASLLSAVAGLVLLIIAFLQRNSDAGRRCVHDWGRRRSDYEEVPGSNYASEPSPPGGEGRETDDGAPVATSGH